MFDHYRIENELPRLFAGDVDLISITSLQENPNPIYARQIIESARTIYAA